MRITRRPSLAGTTATETAGAIAPAAAPPPQADGTSGDDTVNLSDAARLRQRLRADIGDVQQTDGARVAHLRGEVAAGTYAPGADTVAQSLLGELANNLLV